jgi:hypothetical protein
MRMSLKIRGSKLLFYKNREKKCEPFRKIEIEVKCIHDILILSLQKLVTRLNYCKKCKIEMQNLKTKRLMTLPKPLYASILRPI